jgi:hypothetical protein
MTIKTTLAAVCTTAFLLQAPLAIAQDATPAPDTAPAAAPSAAATPAPSTSSANGPGGGSADFRQRMSDRMKAALKASDDEWAVIQPLLEKVQTAQRATMAGRFGGFGRRGGFGGGGPGGPGGNGGQGGNGGPGGNAPSAGASPAGSPSNRWARFDSPEADALRTALASDSTSPEEIKTKLQALRDARKKAAADLEQARADLQKVLTLRQEATLVQMGVLE